MHVLELPTTAFSNMATVSEFSKAGQIIFFPLPPDATTAMAGRIRRKAGMGKVSSLGFEHSKAWTPKVGAHATTQTKIRNRGPRWGERRGIDPCNDSWTKETAFNQVGYIL